MMGWMNPNNLTRKNMSSYSPYCTIMAEEINTMLDEFVGEMKQALDYCFDVLYDDAWGYLSDEDKDNIRNAKEIYDKHFVC